MEAQTTEIRLVQQQLILINQMLKKEIAATWEINPKRSHKNPKLLVNNRIINLLADKEGC